VTTLAAGVGARIRRYREDAGASQADLAGELGVAQTTISYWECGRRQPGLDDLAAIAGVFGVPVADLLGVSGGEWQAGFDAGWAACAKRVTGAAARGGR
jgi:transcriptional regulator with XRE-family HTH domain